MNTGEFHLANEYLRLQKDLDTALLHVDELKAAVKAAHATILSRRGMDPCDCKWCIEKRKCEHPEIMHNTKTDEHRCVDERCNEVVVGRKCGLCGLP